MTRTIDTTGTAGPGSRTTGRGRWRGPTFATVTLVVLALVGVVPATPALAANTGGVVVGWGYNYDGEVNVPSGLTNVTAIAAGQSHSLALKSDGTVVGWGDNYSGQRDVPAVLSGVVTAIAAGMSHSLALKSDGTVVGWGDNHSGQRDAPADLTDAVAISAGGLFSLALKSDGKVVAWGDNSFGQRDVPADLTNVVAISAGGYHSLALKSDGTVVGWGNNANGELNVPSGLTNVTAIAAGTSFSLAITTDVVPPTLTVPAAMTVEATGPTGAVVNFTAAAVDNTDPNPTVTCTPASGAAFPLGSTPVTCTARDASGNTATGGFTVTVVDSTPPVLTLPANQTAIAAGPGGATVTWPAPTANDAVSGSRPVACTPASGTLFPLGVTLVHCAAADLAGNSANGSFSVTVGYAYRTVSVSTPIVGGVAAFGVQLVDRTGQNISSGTIGLRAVTIDGHALDPKISKTFTYSSLLRSYGYALSTKGLARGKHTLGFTAGTDPATHDITFTVR